MNKNNQNNENLWSMAPVKKEKQHQKQKQQQQLKSSLKSPPYILFKPEDCLTAEQVALLKDVIAFVKCEPLEHFFLYHCHGVDVSPFFKSPYDTQKLQVRWTHGELPFQIQVGTHDGFKDPLAITVKIDTIEGKKVCFYSGCSTFDCYGMVYSWILENFHTPSSKNYIPIYTSDQFIKMVYDIICLNAPTTLTKTAIDQEQPTTIKNGQQVVLSRNIKNVKQYQN